MVYEPQASDNEGSSAALARTRPTELGAGDELIECVDALIVATSNHWDAPAMGDGDYFLDADIAILGAQPGIYDRYADDIRAEYSFAPDLAYRAGRSHFLSKAIERQRLFRTAEFETSFGAMARANMRGELARLS